MRHPLNLALIEREIRRSVCSDCPNRSPGPNQDLVRPRACERNCPVFQELPALLYAAERLDPLVANYDTAIADLIRHRCEGNRSGHAGSHDSPLFQHRRVIGRVVKDCLIG